MLEPSDLLAGINRLLVGFGLVVSSTAYLLVVAFVGAGSGHHLACYGAIAALGCCSLGYVSQLIASHRGLAMPLVAASWGIGAFAGVALLF